MGITVHIDALLKEQNIMSKDLAEQVGISAVNFSRFKTGKAKAIRFSVLESLCEALNCQPGDILSFEADADSNGVDEKEMHQDDGIVDGHDVVSMKRPEAV